MGHLTLNQNLGRGSLEVEALLFDFGSVPRLWLQGKLPRGTGRFPQDLMEEVENSLPLGKPALPVLLAVELGAVVPGSHFGFAPPTLPLPPCWLGEVGWG